MLPVAGANTVDGLGVGLGGEVFARRASQDFGYDVKLTGLLWVTTRLDYTSDWLRLEVVGDPLTVYGQVAYRGWKNLRYAGVGGADVLLDHGPVEAGNTLAGPSAFVGLSTPVGRGLSVYGQLYGRVVRVDPGEGSLLEADQPLGSSGGGYSDLTVGLYLDRVDRWPLPTRGLRGEIDLRGGATLSPGAQEALAGVHGEIIGWQPVLGEHLVLGGRLLAARTVGERPFFEQSATGGKWRDELGSEQAFSGYGRTRTRGDGAVAGMVELRPFFGRTNHSFWDIGLYASLFAELGYLFEGSDPGPPMPTVGLAPELLWQSAIQLRPFIAWGWRAEAPGDARQPGMQFGVSFLDPL